MYTFQAHIVCYDVNIPVKELVFYCIELLFYSYNMYIRITFKYLLSNPSYYKIAYILK